MNSKSKTSNQRVSRRAMLRWLALAGAGTVTAACGVKQVEPTSTGKSTKPEQPITAPTSVQAQPKPTADLPTITPTQPSSPSTPTGSQAYLAVAHGEDPQSITTAAIKALGGIERFVKPGFDVIIKPNICTDYYPFEYGATTNPVVVATLVKLALGAGAKRVRVMDSPFGGMAESAYVKSGIGDAVKEAGGVMELMNYNKYKKTAIPEGKSITEWDIYQDALSCDLLINVPIAKHHQLARITVGEKNMMGLIQYRTGIHSQMSQRIPDLVSVIKPDLTVVDAVRTLMANGPTGGNLDDVKLNNMVIASHDVVAADAYAATLFDLTGEDIPYIKNAAERGLGTLDLSSVKVEEINA